MPYFSIVIPAYNNERYLSECIKSIQEQSFMDWEAVVVIDGSPDNSFSVASELAASDDRVKVVNKIKNEGTHLARRTGVLNSTGDYIYLLDADDSLPDGCLKLLADAIAKTDADMFHFGINVIDVDINEQDCLAFESYINKPMNDLEGIEICRAAYDSGEGFLQDWRITQRVYKSDLLKRAFETMTTDRLGRAQDGYEYFVVSSLATKQVTHNDIVALNYYYGRGVNSDSELAPEKFLQSAQHFQMTIDAIKDYASGDSDLSACAQSGSEKLYDLIMNDWLLRLSERNKLVVLPELSEIFGNGELSNQLARLARDGAYQKVTEESPLDVKAPYYLWLKEALKYASLAGETDTLAGSYLHDAIHHVITLGFNFLKETGKTTVIDKLVDEFGSFHVAETLYTLIRDAAYDLYMQDLSIEDDFRLYDWLKLADSIACNDKKSDLDAIRHEAIVHISELEHRAGMISDYPQQFGLAKKRDYESKDIRIFVTTHKDVDTFFSDILQPVQVGAKLPRKRLLWAFQDDSGVNISEKNLSYCELTTQYWAWKNADAKYYGFCHYRRYFDFSDEMHAENAYGEVLDKYIDWGSQARYGLSDDAITDAVEGWDIITTGIKDLNSFPEHYKSPLDHYERAPYLKVSDLKRAVKILKKLHPDYAADADAYLSGHFMCFCNMYVMRKELFFRYCEWMFPILDEFCSNWDTSKLSHEAVRTPGHLSERLFNIWLLHEKRTNSTLKHKEVQCVHFEYPEHVEEPHIAPLENRDKPVVPVVFAADNNYVPMVTTTICSMLENASIESFYDIVILEKDFSERNKRIMSDFFSQYENASIRFANVSGMVKAFNLQTSNEHISVETYYRFLIQQVLPGYDKVLYLDSDLIVEGDISKLFATDLGSNLIGAAIDIDYLGNLNMNDGKRLKYTTEVLRLKHPYSYFQAGVLILNTAEMRKLHPFKKWLEMASEPKYIYDDQDILNAHCQGRVTYLNNAWNVMNDCGGRIKNVFTFAPAAVFDAFMDAYAKPLIIHYAGSEKPWKPGHCDLAESYWSYARLTPFYEELFNRKFADKDQVAYNIDRAINDFEYRLTTPPKAISEDSPLRNVFDGVLPMGSRRREAAKAIVRTLRGRK